MNIRSLLDQPREILEQFSRDKAKYAYLGNHLGLVTVLGKFRTYVDTRDVSVAPHLIMDGCWEPWVTMALRRVPRGAFAVDVGANHGYFSLLLAELTERTVLAFEPQEHLARLISKSAKVNGLKVEVREEGVGSQIGSGELVYAENQHNFGTVNLEHHAGLSDDENFVHVVDLDSCLEMAPDFIKIDAEGSEHEIWAGMSNILAKRPTILMEFTPHLYPDAEGFLKDIQSCYPLREVSPQGEIEPISASKILEHEEFVMLWLEKE